MVLGQAYEQKGRLSEAIAEFEGASSLDGASSMYAACLAHALALAGRRAEALKLLEDLNQRAEHGFICSYDRAVAHVGLGNREKSFELLNAAVQERSPRTAFLGVDPRLDGLRTDARFSRLLRSSGLP
jgi:tetratricopeptide (TPR) repeat protein